MGPLLALALAAGCASSAAESYAALVNGSRIAEKDVEAQFRRALDSPGVAEQFKGPDRAARSIGAKREILMDLIKSKVALEYAGKRGIKLEDGELSKAIERGKAGFVSEEAFSAEMGRPGVTRKRLGEVLLEAKVVNDVTKGVTVSDEEVRQAYEQNRALFEAQFHAMHILVCAQPDPATGACPQITPDAESLAASLASRARSGEDFGSIAREFSKDQGTASRGGDLGWYGPGQLVPEFEQAAAALGPGQVSDPVRTQFGIHVIKMVAKGRGLEEARADIRAQLLNPRKRLSYERWLRGALERASIRVDPEFGRYDPEEQKIVAG